LFINLSVKTEELRVIAILPFAGANPALYGKSILDFGFWILDFKV
jgi:hypothetical protein